MPYVDAADLASTAPGKGASMVGLEGGGTVQAKLRQPGIVSAIDFVPGANRSSIQNYTYGSDTSAWLAAGDAIGDMYIPNGLWRVANTLDKAFASWWRGETQGSVSGEGARIKAMTDAPLVRMDAQGVTDYSNGGMENLRFENVWSEESNPTAIQLKNGVRQQFFERLQIQNFSKGLDITGCGELYLKSLFIAGGDYGILANGLADSWIDQCSIGDGSGLNGPYNGSHGYGGWFQSCNNLQFTNCRPQVSAKYNLFMLDCVRISLLAGICDQANLGGMVFAGDCDHILVQSWHIFDNGKTNANGSGIAINVGDGEAMGTLILDTNQIYDRNKGTAAQRQDKAIVVTCTGSGHIDKLVIRGNDLGGCQRGIVLNNPSIGELLIEGSSFTGCTDAVSIQGSDNIQRKVVSNCPGLTGTCPSQLSIVGDSGIALNESVGGRVRWDSPISAHRTANLIVDTDKLVDGASAFTLIRSLSATGNFSILVSANGTNFAALTAPGTSMRVVWQQGAWVVEEYPTHQEATASQIGSSTSHVNTLGKYAGAACWDSTNGAMLHATGASAGDPWT
ncbi:MAG: hypothetical protein AB7E24_12040 [Novosphingobium sp.]